MVLRLYFVHFVSAVLVSDTGLTVCYITLMIRSMANNGFGTENSQFFILFDEAPWLNGKHTVFGKVCNDDAEEVLKK